MVRGGLIPENVAEQQVLAVSDLVADAYVFLLVCCSGGSVEHGEVGYSGYVCCGYCHDTSKASGIEVVQSGEMGLAQSECVGAVD